MSDVHCPEKTSFDSEGLRTPLLQGSRHALTMSKFQTIRKGNKHKCARKKLRTVVWRKRALGLSIYIANVFR